jgi:hypothetical protein
MSKTMANNIILSLKETPPTFVSADMLTASARWLNGNDLSDALGLKQVSLYYWALMAGQCLFFAVYCYMNRLVPAWDRDHVRRAKIVFWGVIVKAKWGLANEETTFDFKYVPEYDTLTELGKHEERKLTRSAIESRNLRTFAMFAGTSLVVLAAGTYASVRVASRILGTLW